MALQKNRGRLPMPGDLAVVVGAGRSGRAAAKMLARANARVRLLEANPEALSQEHLADLASDGVEVVLEPHARSHFENAAFVIPSPGLPIASLEPFLKDSAAEVISEMELAWRYLGDEPVLAVTGTSGKTTTASLAAAMLKAQGYTVFLGGNIGTPLSEYILDSRKADVIVVEVSSFQLQGCTTFCPRAAVLLNISPNHLDYHRDMREYTEAKFRIFRCQDENDLAVLGQDTREIAESFSIPSRKVWIRDEGRFPQSRLLGAHNRLNEEAAWQAAKFFGVSEANAARAVARFAPLPHRLEKVAAIDGVTYINDSKATTPSALKVALEAIDGSVVLLCGGKFKGGDLRALAPLVHRKARKVILFGASREQFTEAWQDAVSLSWQPNLKSALQEARREARPGDTVLLSPATASFDQYPNYMARGEDFRNIVRSMDAASAQKD